MPVTLIAHIILTAGLRSNDDFNTLFDVYMQEEVKRINAEGARLSSPPVEETETPAS